MTGSDEPRLPRAVRHVVEALAAAGHTAEIRILSASARTAVEAAAALGVEPSQIVKSLVFRRRLSHRPLLALVDGASQVDPRRLKLQAGEPIERPDAAWVREHTGFAIGGIPPLGHSPPLPIIADRWIAEQPLLWAAAGTPHAVFPVAGDELVRIARALVAPIALR